MWKIFVYRFEDYYIVFASACLTLENLKPFLSGEIAENEVRFLFYKQHFYKQR